MEYRKHIEAIESSRVGSSDLADHFPETADAIRDNERLKLLAARVHQVDQSILTVMESVEIPDGLAERLHASISKADGSTEPARRTETMQGATAAKWPSRFAAMSRRRLVAIAGGLAVAAACLFVAAIYGLRGTAEDEMRSLIVLFDATREDRDHGNWASPPDGFALPTVIRGRAIRTLEVTTARHGDVTLVRLGRTATLLVLEGERRALPSEPMVQKGGPTGRIDYTAWSSGGFTYLLAVEDGELEGFFRKTGALFSQALPALDGLFSSISTTVTGSNSLIEV